MNLTKRKKEKGITLIALLITIIVLIVLAAVVIVNLTGEDNIVEKGLTGVEAYDISQYEEMIRLAETEARLDRMENKEIVFLDRVQEILENNQAMKGANYAKVEEAEKKYLQINIKQYTFFVRDEIWKNREDKIKPIAIIENLGETAYIGLFTTARVMQQDEMEGSGIAIQKCKYQWNQEETKLGTEETLYEGKFGQSEEEISWKPSSSGKWFLHILTTDNAGNQAETVSHAITVPTETNLYLNGEEYQSLTGGWNVSVWSRNTANEWFEGNGTYTSGTAKKNLQNMKLTVKHEEGGHADSNYRTITNAYQSGFVDVTQYKTLSIDYDFEGKKYSFWYPMLLDKEGNDIFDGFSHKNQLMLSGAKYEFDVTSVIGDKKLAIAVDSSNTWNVDWGMSIKRITLKE